MVLPDDAWVHVVCVVIWAFCALYAVMQAVWASKPHTSETVGGVAMAVPVYVLGMWQAVYSENAALIVWMALAVGIYSISSAILLGAPKKLKPAITICGPPLCQWMWPI